jgi:xanthine dehydrogenase accessory factor
MEYDVVRVVDARQKSSLETEAPGMRIETLESLETLVRRAGRAAAVVVASQGHYDEEALASVLKAGAGYVGLVASRKRGATVQKLLAESGVDGTAAIRVPAGLDLGARTPPEIALSILAEIVEAQFSEAPSKSEATTETRQVAASSVAIDPVCGMRVQIAGARHTASLDGVEYYFCGAGCRAGFVKDPQAFLQSRS